MMTVSRRGVLEIAGHEGIVLGPYRDSAGVWTYGVGHTAGAGAPDPAAMPRTDTRRWSEDTAHKELVRAIRLFDEDLDSYETRVDGAIQVPLKQHQFDALVSWDFNTGGATWRSASGQPAQLVRQINAGDLSGAGFMGWLRPPEIRQRRTEEMNLFRTGRYHAGGDAIAVWDALGDGRIRHRSTITASELSRLMDEADAHHRPATGGVLRHPALLRHHLQEDNMTRLVTQPTAAPTRKMWAVILSGIVTATVQTLLETYAPDLPITEILAQIDVWVQALVMAGFGYAVRDRG